MSYRLKLLIAFIIVAAISIYFGMLLERKDTTANIIRTADQLFDLQFTQTEMDSMLSGLQEKRDKYQKIRENEINNNIPPALQFNPIPQDFDQPNGKDQLNLSPAKKMTVPENLEELAFYSVHDLSELIRSKKLSSLHLTKMYLQRLNKYGPKLECVVTLTEKLALEQAERADMEISSGYYRGPLHGIPYGAKDLLAVKDYPTTWGATPYKDQIIDSDAAVIQKLEQAGAVLVAKLTLGALAWGDVWFGGKTRNPWNLEQGSSGSSAGSASATAAGLVAFAIGTETWGSIVSPSTRCGTTGLRPTYGQVCRTGAMALSWSMDKIGPICRTVEDCAIVFDAIRGQDGLDQTVYDLPFSYQHDSDIKTLRVGFLKDAFEAEYANQASDKATLKMLQEMGIDLMPIQLPDLPVDALSFILSAEAAAAFDELTRSGSDDLMVRQIKNAWPNVFREARLIPAVEYLQANRMRYQLIQQMQEVMEKVDVYVAPSFGGNNLLLTNLTGHPCVVLPNGFNEKGSPVSISFIGQLFEEGKLLALAKQYQDRTDYHLQHPPNF